MDAREALEAVSRGYYEPHPCGPCDLGVTSAPCNCLPVGESGRRMSAALGAVLELHRTAMSPPRATPTCMSCHQIVYPCPTVKAITDALAGEG